MGTCDKKVSKYKEKNVRRPRARREHGILVTRMCREYSEIRLES